MITTSTAISNAISQNARFWSNCIAVEKSNGETDFTLYDLKKYTIERSLVQGSDYTIGSTYMAKLSCVATDTLGRGLQIEDFLDKPVSAIARIRLSDGTFGSIRVGKFYISEVQKKGSDFHLVGYDTVSQLQNKAINGTFTTQDLTASQIMTELARRSGVTYTSANFSYDPVIPASRYNSTDLKYTTLDLMQWVATVCSANIVCDEYGRITMRRPTTIDYKRITKNDYSEFTFNEAESITGLKVNRPIDKNRGKEYSFGDSTGKTIVIEGNPLLALDLSEEIYNTLTKLTLRQFDVKLPLGDPRLEVGDIIYISDFDKYETLYTFYILQQEINLCGGCSMRLSADIRPYQDDKVEYQGTQKIKTQQLSDKVDLLEQDLADYKTSNDTAVSKRVVKGEPFSKLYVGSSKQAELSISDNIFRAKMSYGSYSSGVELLQNKSNSNSAFRPQNTDSTQLGQASYKWTAVYATNTNIQSDRKVKRDIQDIEDAQKFIMSLRPRQYKMKNSDTEKGRLHYGFIAQEVNEVATNVMKKDLSMCRASYVTYDENGNAVDNYFRADLSDEVLSWYIDYNELISPLVALVQSQQRQIEELESKLLDLQDKIK